jgi:NADPH2:quinone reductase
MKAWLIDKIGAGVQGLRVGTVMDPEPKENEVVLEVTYAALNPADRYLAEGQYPAKPSMPHILGRDGIGTVVELGPGLHEPKVGEKRLVLRSEIGVNRPGTLAQRVAVPVESLVIPPPGWTDEQSAAAPLVYLTAWQALTMWGELPPAVILVTGASGGVGVACVQLARGLGHTVVALSRSQEKREHLERLGASHALDPSDHTWPQTLKTLLGRKRVDLAIDNIGGEELPRVIETLAEDGRVSCVGRLAGPVPQFNTATLFFRRLRLGGVHVGSYKPHEAQAAWKHIVDSLARTGTHPLVDRVFAFDELVAAFERLREGPMGKVLLAVK